MCSSKLATFVAFLGFSAFASTEVASAEQLVTGDVVISVSKAIGIPPATESSIKIYSPSGVIQTTVPLPSLFGMHDLTFHSGTLFGRFQFGTDAAIYKIALDGTLTAAGVPVGGPFVFDSSGNIYVAHGQSVDKFDSTGTQVSTWTLPTIVKEIDLASDQCTLYYLTYTLAFTVARFNLCTSQSLSPLTSSLSASTEYGNPRLLPDNSLLLGTSNNVMRIGSDGTVLRTYSGCCQVALDVDGRSFWAAAGTDRAIKVDLFTGEKVAFTAPELEGFPVDSLTVVGEPRAAVAPSVDIPGLSELALVALALTLMVIAALSIRR